MTPPSFVRLISLSAIWGASFLFMRIGVPLLGPALLVQLRVGLAALFLLCVGMVLRKRLDLRHHWRHFLTLGLLNSALPFLLFAWAAQTLSASLLSILNATAPIFAAVVGAAWHRTALSRRATLGLALGVAGVALLVGFDPAALRTGAPAAILLGLAGALSYGVATHYARSSRKVEPFANAHGSMWAATVLVAPALALRAHESASDPTAAAAVAAVLGLGVLCSGVAYLLYFRLIADIGATSALTVTFLVPVFGLLWGHLFLGEPVGWSALAGAGVVVLGTALTTGFSPAALARKTSTLVL